MFADVHKKCGYRWKIVRELRWFCAAHFLLCFFFFCFYKKHTRLLYMFIILHVFVCATGINSGWPVKCAWASKHTNSCTHVRMLYSTQSLRTNQCTSWRHKTYYRSKESDWSRSISTDESVWLRLSAINHVHRLHFIFIYIYVFTLWYAWLSRTDITFLSDRPTG